MRKLFSIVLVVILASAISVVGFGVPGKGNGKGNDKNIVGTASDNANAIFNVNTSISLSITDGEQVQFGNLNPGDSKTINNGTTMKVVANSDLNWEVKADVSSGKKTPAEAADALTVGMNGNTGSGESSNITADYSLNLPDTMPSGTHTVIVTFTAYAK